MHSSVNASDHFFYVSGVECVHKPPQEFDGITA